MTYSIPEYLLDRANIHDTLTKVPIFYDTVNLSGLASEVFAAEIDIDYTSILGGTPTKYSRADWITLATTLLDGFASSQHITTGIITDLPQPTPSATRPNTAAVHAQAGGSMVGKTSGDYPGLLTQNGGLLEAELQRDPELEKQGVNPWRITKYKVIKKWDRGDTTVSELVKN